MILRNIVKLRRVEIFIIAKFPKLFKLPIAPQDPYNPE